MAIALVLLAQQPPPPPPPKVAPTPPRRLRIGWSAQSSRLRRWVAPESAPDDRNRTVRLRIIIDTDGAVRSAEFVSGDRAVAASARSAVLQWAFQRTGLSTDWAEVETVAEVAFPPRFPCAAP